MGRAPCCDKTKVKRGPWSPEEDDTLKNYLDKHGTGGNWIALPHKAGLNRCGKSCRLRWLNYLRPDIKHGGFTEEEDNIICTVYNSIGSRWSVIASKLPGRTDNDVKNYWNTKLKKKLLAGKTSFHCNNETIKHTNQSNLAQIQKTDNVNFSTCLNASSSALPYQMDSNSVNWQRFDSHELNLEQNQFSKLSHVAAASNFSISSSPADQDRSSLSTNSALENSLGFNHEDEALKQLGFDYCNDVFLNEFGF